MDSDNLKPVSVAWWAREKEKGPREAIARVFLRAPGVDSGSVSRRSRGVSRGEYKGVGLPQSLLG